KLLEKISLFVGTLGGTETGQRLLAMLVANPAQTTACELKCLFPRCLAEHVHDVVRVHREVTALGCIGTPDQRLGQTMGVMGVIETVTALHAQALLVRRAIAPFHEENLVILDVVGELAADTAERANG